MKKCLKSPPTLPRSEEKENYQNTFCDTNTTWLSSKPKENTTSKHNYKVLPGRNIQYKVHNKLK